MLVRAKAHARRRRLAAIVSLVSLAAMATPASAAPQLYRAAGAHTHQDARSDVESENGPATQPEADIVSISAEHRGEEVALTVLSAAPTDPATHPAWAGDTLVLWGLSTQGAAEPDYIVGYFRDEAGRVVYEIARTDGNAGQGCSGPADRDAAGAFRATFKAACIGSPASFRYAAAMQWDGGAPSGPVADGAPEQGLVGPVDAPVPVGPPVTDDPDPSYDPGEGGYWLTAADGGVFSFGDATFHGSTGHIRLNQPIVGMAADLDHDGYWFVARDGGIFAFDAPFHGSTGNLRLNQPIVGMAPTATGKGYWMVASDGGIFSFGDAGFYGSTGNIRLSQPIVGMAPTATGKGYWMVASDGGIFGFGDAGFYGSMGGKRTDHPVVGMAPTRTGRGYWLVDRGGNVYAYGDALFWGNAKGGPAPVVGLAPARDGNGYSIARADGSVAHFGSAPKAGSLAGRPLNQPVTGIAMVP